MDFALILVVATALTGVIWLFDAVVLRSGRTVAAAGGATVREPVVVEYAKSFFVSTLASAPATSTGDSAVVKIKPDA